MRKLSRRNFVKVAGVGAIAGAISGGKSATNVLAQPPSATLAQDVHSTPTAAADVPAIPRIVCTHFANDFKPTCLSNGVIGIRPAANPLAQAQTLVSGFVRTHPTMIIESMSPAPYPLGTDIKLNGHSLLASPASLQIKSQTLDMSAGELSTEMMFSPEGGCSLELKVLQFVSRSVPGLLCQEILLAPSSDATVEILTRVDYNGIGGSVYLDRLPFPEPDPDLQVMGFRNDRNRLGIGIAVLPNDGLSQKGEGLYGIAAKAGRTYTFRTIASMVAEAYDPEPELQAIRLLGWGKMLGFERLEEQNRKEWAELWNSRVKVHGDTEAQRALDAAFFYLHSNLHPSCRTGMAPYGLSQFEALEGHVFWDMDSWCLPAALLASPTSVKAMLEYRLRGLEAAQKRAELFGYRGAQFPWEAGINGNEECPPFVATGWAEQHIVPDVALAFWEYQQAADDRDFLRNGTWQVLKSVAEWIESRGEFTTRGFEIRNVMGVDESLPRTDNNSYMNLACRMTMQAAVECCRKLGVVPSENWERIARSMFIPLDTANRVVLPYDNAKPGPAYSVGMLQFLFLHKMPVGPDLFKNTYEFEEDLRVRMPSGASNPCSPKAPGFTCPPFAACAAYFGDRRKAAELFTNAWKPYWVEPYGLTKEYQFFPDGNYVTGCASLLMAATFGFTGLRISDGDWRRYPAALPEGWSRIEIERIWVKGKPKALIAEQGKLAVIEG
jgi:trehalose/maltose hydrolase-like predicted phosphorylase